MRTQPRDPPSSRRRTLDLLPAKARRYIPITLPRTASGSISAKVVYDGPIKAPIAKGQPIAHLIVSTDDTEAQVMPLVAGEAVSEAGFFGRLWNGLKSFFG